MSSPSIWTIRATLCSFLGAAPAYCVCCQSCGYSMTSAKRKKKTLERIGTWVLGLSVGKARSQFGSLTLNHFFLQQKWSRKMLRNVNKELEPVSRNYRNKQEIKNADVRNLFFLPTSSILKIFQMNLVNESNCRIFKNLSPNRIC